MRPILARIARTIQLNEQQRRDLTGIAQSRVLPAGYVFRAKLILMLDEGATFASIRERLGTTTRRLFVGKNAYWQRAWMDYIPAIPANSAIGSRVICERRY